MQDEGTGQRETLANFLSVLNQRLPTLSDTLTAAYFRTTKTPHQLVRLRSKVEE